MSHLPASKRSNGQPEVSRRRAGRLKLEGGIQDASVVYGSGQLDDSQLLRDLRRGGTIALHACAELYRRHYEELVRRLERNFSSVTVGDREDAVQMVFQQLWEGRECHHGRGSVLAYLASCAHHRLANQLRSQHARARRELSARRCTSDASVDTPLEILCTCERRQRLRTAVPRLPPQERDVIELVAFVGCSLQQAADVIGVSRRTVKRRFAAAIALLRTALLELSDV